MSPSETEGKNVQLFILNSSPDSFLFHFPFKPGFFPQDKSMACHYDIFQLQVLKQSEEGYFSIQPKHYQNNGALACWDEDLIKMLIRCTENCASSQNVPIKTDLDTCSGILVYAPGPGFCFLIQTQCSSHLEKKCNHYFGMTSND